jgi:CheY-like chemotaxis protein
MICVDPEQMEKAFVHMALNARDALEEGGIFRVELRNVHLEEPDWAAYRSAPPGEYVLISVRDNGCGMEPETVERIFEPYYTTKGMGRGRGLGLSTVYGIVKQSGGYIWADSEEGVGSEFRLYFPRREDSRDEDDFAQLDLDNLFSRETVVVSSGNATLRQILSQALTSYGYRVITTRDLQSAERVLESSETGNIDLLLTDILMPGTLGAMMDRIRERFPSVKILYSSWMPRTVLNQMRVSIGEGQIVTRPLTHRAIVDKVRETLTGS